MASRIIDPNPKPNKERLKVLFITVGGITDPSSRVRVFQFLPFLRNHFDRVDVLVLGADGQLCARLRQLRALFSSVRHDVVVLQKVASVPLVKTIQRLTRRLIWDIDDAVCLCYPQMNNVLPLFEKVIVGNSELEKHVVSCMGQPKLIPTVIDETRFPLNHMPERGGMIVIGWIGHGTNVRYLESLRPVFETLARKLPGRFVLRVVSDCGLDWGVPIENRPWSLERELSDVRSFDIGIMPLEDDDWSRQKCGYKALLYMSQGAPAVISPIGVNAQIVTDGVDGFHAITNLDWENKLSILINDAELRHRLGFEAQKKVRQSYTIAAVLPDWIEVLKGTS